MNKKDYTKDEMVKILLEKATKLFKNYTEEGERELWEEAFEWNKRHRFEIWIWPICDDYVNVNGLMIEDKEFYY